MSGLHQAIIRHNLQQVRLLTRMGCDVNRPDLDKRTPIRLVCDVTNERLRVALGRILLKHGARIDDKDQSGVSSFSYACGKQRWRLVQLMIQEREIPWLDTDNKENTALHHAVTSGNEVVTRMVVDQMRKYGLDLDPRNNNGQTPLIVAERLGHKVCAQVLRETGRASTAARDSHVFKNADQWRSTWTEKTSRKLSNYFSQKFPYVADHLKETVNIKGPALQQQGLTQKNNKWSKHHLHSGKSVKGDALPTLLKLYKEQLMDSYRTAAKPVIAGTHQASQSPADLPENHPHSSEQVTRKALSFARLTTQQVQFIMNVILKHNSAHRSSNESSVERNTSPVATGFKGTKEPINGHRTVQELRRRNTADSILVKKKLCSVPRRNTEIFKTVSEETLHE